MMVTPDPTVQLLSVSRYKNGSRLLFRFEYRLNQERQIRHYISDDRGITWQNIDLPISIWGQSDITTVNTTKLVSHVDQKILYDCGYKCKDGFPVSTDGGETWAHINPTLSDGGTIDAIQLVDTGMHSASRVYAKIWSEKIVRSSYRHEFRIGASDEFQIGVSDDYGRHFRLLPQGLIIIGESRKNPLILYGQMLLLEFNILYKYDEKDIAELKLRNPWNLRTPDEDKTCLVVSKDGGESWEAMEGGLPITDRRIFEGMDDRNDIRTWRQYKNDRELPGGDSLKQIESDPKHSEYIYFLMSSGLYFSRNFGKTFRFANLAVGALWDTPIDRIAVDPVDGRYVYAIDSKEKFYRSSNYGCTWELMPLPVFPE